MNHIKKPVAVLTAVTIIFLVVYNVTYFRKINNDNHSRYIVINRINSEIAALCSKTESVDSDRLNLLIEKNIIRELGSESSPDKVIFLPIKDDLHSADIPAEKNTYIMSVYSDDGVLLGFAKYTYYDNTWLRHIIVINTAVIICYLIIILVFIYINQKILRPFHRFADYPEELAKGRIQNKIPETKNRYFGKYIWGMNMLSDLLANDKNKLLKMEYDRQTMLTSIAHGVKTPVANIKLYADAIETGLYRENGIPDASDAKIAEKIEKNAMDIEKMVTELITVSSSALCDYSPDIETFYIRELADLVEREYKKRFHLNHINYNITCTGNPSVTSDKEGLFKMLSQLIENAIKYGDGNSLSISFDKQDDGFYFSVKNSGTLLSEHEIPFVFKSFWRGSNAGDIKGSGVGLFVVKEMAHKLGGEVFAKCWHETGQMEFIIYLNS